jgi:hypothetical protein
MEEVRRLISASIDIDDGTMSLLINKLTELGVRTVADLVDVQVGDLSPAVLLPIPARRLVRKWSEDHSTAAGEQALASSSTPHTRTTLNPHTPSGQMSTTPLTSSTAENVSSWHTKFNASLLPAHMMDGTQSRLTKQAAANLQDAKQLCHAERNEVVRCTVEVIMKLCSTPSRNNGLNYVAQKIVDQYPQLKDIIAGQVIGSGFTSFRNQLENRITYLKRPVNCSRRAVAVRRRLIDNETENQSQKRQIRDGYGCVEFLPVALPENENEESLNQKQLSLKEMFTSNTWTDGEVAELMESTYILQRQDLVGPSSLPFSEVLDEWPFLAQPRFMLQHLEQLLGFNLNSQLQNTLMSKKKSFVDYFGSKLAKSQTLKNRFYELRNDPAVEIVIPLLMAYFEEEEKILLNSFEVIE